MLERIREELERSGGWMPFARYMELVLHAPGAGYYASGARKFGAGGDFVTAPELGSLFARTFARQLAEILEPGEGILEVGAGSGALAAQLSSLLECEYTILETSGELRARQRERLGTRVRWLDALPRDFRGAIVANEVLDAMPVHAVAWREAGILERGVVLRDGALQWAERPAAGELLRQAEAISQAADLPRPYESEIGLVAQAWMRALAGSLERGAAFIVDYGFPRHEYYHPERAGGTLMCHHRHSAHAEVFRRPGGEDLTAHVDFSAMAAAAREGGLEILGYATQAQFLVNCGITEVLGEANVENALHYAPLAAEANRLLSPAEMGELFKVLAVGRGVKRALRGYTVNDRSHTL